MKKFILSLLTIAACSTVQAADVSQQQAIAKAKAQPYYNLSGQRVLHPRRGLYIQGGRKIVK